MKKFALTALILLSACIETENPNNLAVSAAPTKLGSGSISAAKSASSYSFKDPSSAQFRALTGYRLANKDTVVCGQVNAKNSYGAYVGYKAFYVRLRRNVAVSTLSDYWATNACTQASSGTIRIPG